MTIIENYFRLILLRSFSLLAGHGLTTDTDIEIQTVCSASAQFCCILITFFDNKGDCMPVKPTDQEEEFFARQEFERMKDKEEQRVRDLESAEKQKLQMLHYMHCPKCGMQLVEIDYRGIKIDRCTACDGVWLDAGELEEIAKLDAPLMGKFFSIFK